MAEAETAEECLAILAEQLAELGLKQLAAEPTRFGNQQLASHLALVAAA